MSTAPLLEEQEKIVIIDFGSPYNQLLTRRIRELGMYSELHPHTMTAEDLKKMNATGVILSGGPLTASDADAYKLDPEILATDIPLLGVCYGAQLVVNHFGGEIETVDARTYRETKLTVEGDSKLFAGQAQEQTVWESVGHTIAKLPAGFEMIAKNDKDETIAIGDEARGVYGLMYEPGVEQSTEGIAFLKHFIYEVCQSKGDWSMARFAELEVEKIRDIVGDKKVLCALSGGVDSSVVAALIHRAVGDQLTCMFVDHGLLRKGEAESVVETFANRFNMNFIKVDAQERFLTKLEGVADPEEKRKIIGNEFIYVFDDEATKLEGIDFLAQGTLYTDILESGTLTSETIKSHHNVGGLPEDMEFELIEPLGALFKDEVRALGSELGLSDEIVWRQPFPGPGLGIRVLGEVTREKLAIVRESDAILREEIANAGLDREIWQYFTVLPDIRSVGVKNGQRTYDYAVGIRAVTSVDGTTSGVANIPWEVLGQISQRITSEVSGVNRVLYDITGKPPGTIEWE